jgi:hypothetical protein
MPARAVAALCLLLVVCTLASAQQTYDLRSRYRVGQVILVQDRGEMEITVPEPGIGGKDGLSPGRYYNLQTSEVRYRVLEAKGGIPTLKRAYVVSAEEADETPDSEPTRAASSLVGKVILIKTVPGKEPVYMFQNGDPVDPDEAQNWLEDLGGQLDSALGRKLAGLKVGDEIAATREEIAKVFDVSQGDLSGLKLRLEEVTQRNGEPAARIHFAANLNAAVDKTTMMGMELTGEVLLNLTRHLPDSLEAEGKLTISEPASEGAEPGPKAEGTMKGRTVYALLEG